MIDVIKNRQSAVSTFRPGFLTSPSFIVFLLAISVCGYSVVRALESTTIAAADVGPAVPADLLIPASSVVQPSAETAGGNRPNGGDIETRLTPIETLQVGQRVRADAPTDEVDTQFGDEVIPSDWRKLTLTAPKRDGTVSDVVLLRPREWLEQQQAEVGGQVYIAVPECGIDGNATVHSIEPCPPITDGPGRVITGTFRHRVAGGIELSIAGESQPIRCTGNHPIWSESRQDFVRADSLQPGESLRTTTGLTHVVSTTSLPGETYVYNTEVHGLHVYHVGESGLLVHNGGLNILGGPCFTPKGTGYRVMSPAELAGAAKGKWADSLLVKGDSVESGSKWLWKNKHAAERWLQRIRKHGEDGVITEVPTMKPLKRTKMVVNSWILKWHENTDAGYRRWFFRRITREGAFFGETESVESNTPCRATFEGHLSRDDAEQLVSLARLIDSDLRGGKTSNEIEGWTGLFAIGAVSNPNVLLRYRVDDEKKSDAASAFRQVVEILRPYVES